MKVNFKKSYLDRLERIATIIGVDKPIKVLRRALAVYEFLVDKVDQDAVVIIRPKEGFEYQLDILNFESDHL